MSITSTQSRIFTQAELKSIEQIEKGNRNDEQGLFYGRVKLKIIEMLEFWFKKRKKLEGLVKSRRGK